MVQIANLPNVNEEMLRNFCRRRGVRRLGVFGSASRPDFDPESSDLDIYAEFEPGALRGVGLDFFGYADELSEVFGRKVDLCTRLNRHFRPEVMREMVTIYEQA